MEDWAEFLLAWHRERPKTLGKIGFFSSPSSLSLFDILRIIMAVGGFWAAVVVISSDASYI